MQESATLLFILVGEIPNPLIPDPELENSKPFLERILYVVDKSIPNLIPVNLRMLNRIIRCKTQPVKINSDELCKKSLDIINSDLGVDVVSNILQGNCEIIGIISSPGGHGGTAKDIQNSFDYLNRKGATSKLFVFCQAASAAFILASAFQEKNCLQETEFMFHRGGIPKELEIDNTGENDNGEEADESEIREMTEQNDKEQMTDHLDSFFANCDPEHKNECEEMKKICLENLDADIYYSGEHLLRMGVIKDCPVSPEDLTKLLEETIGINLRPESNIYKLLRSLEVACHDTIDNGIFKSSDGFFSDNESPHIRKHIMS
jgi:hypothetical protein